MDRRTFNSMLGGGAMNLATEAWPNGKTPTNPKIEDAKSQSTKWPMGVYRRMNVDTHIPDWDPRLLANFDAVRYVDMIAQAGFESLLVWANSHVGLCMWNTKVGPLHANMKGRDFFGETVKECHRRGLHAVAYYSLTFDIWAFDHHPTWRLETVSGTDEMLNGRPGVVCLNSPYREQALTQLRELVGNYDFEGIFLDMTYWAQPCYCAHCTERFHQEHHAEPPRIVNWDDPTWRTFQKARQQWLLEFALLVTHTIKLVRPITVSHQCATMLGMWTMGVPLELRDACDFVSGDFYGGPTQYSLICKAYDGLTRAHPFEFWTSRTTDLHDFETTKPFNELLISCCVATIHSAAYIITDSLKPDGTLDPEVYKYLGPLNAKLAPYQPFLGGEMLADVAIYHDNESLYDPKENGVHVSKIKSAGPHMPGVVGAARILREAHIPYGVVTNVDIDKLNNFRAVMVPNVLEMTAAQASRFREFVEKGGILYASGPSSLDRFDPAGPRFLLEDVLGVRYQGTLGTEWTYLTPQDATLKQAIWPQDAFSYPGQMTEAETLPSAQVLATITLPFVDPKVGNCLNVRFAQIWNNPPASTPGTSPGIVVHSFGRGKAIWVAAPIETGDFAVNARLVSSLLRRFLPGPYHFEVDTHPSVEMTIFHQAERQRLLVSLLNMEWRLASIKFNATVRVKIPAGRAATAVLALPERKEIQFKRNSEYVEFRVEQFETMAMAAVEYA